MKGWQIFMHSLRQVFNNLEGALRVSAVLYVGQAVLGLLLLQTVSPWGESANPDGMRTMMMAGDFPWASLIVVVLVAVICNLWIAVGWHRYVLTNEKPALLPALLGDRMWAYFLRGLMIGLILIPVFIVVGLVVGFLAAAGGPPLAAIAAVALAVILAVLSFAVALVGTLAFQAIGLGLVWDFVFGWVQLMVGVSILTTLYGHYIEKRPLM